jgi:hypothetical protein
LRALPEIIPKKKGENKMIDQKDWVNELASLTQASIETGMRNMDMLQQQTEKAIDMTLESVNSIQGESQKGVEGLMDGLKKAQKLYKKAAEDALATFQKKTG